MISLKLIVILMLSLAPRSSISHEMDVIFPVAEAIQKASPNIEDAVTLITISFYETGFRNYRTGLMGVPFGITAHTRNPRFPIGPAAIIAERVINSGRINCSRRRALLLGWYNTGNCIVNNYSRHQTRTIRRLFDLIQNLNMPTEMPNIEEFVIKISSLSWYTNAINLDPIQIAF